MDAKLMTLVPINKKLMFIVMIICAINVYCDDNMCYSTQMSLLLYLPFLKFHSATPPTLKCLIKVSIKQEAGGNLSISQILPTKHKASDVISSNCS